MLRSVDVVVVGAGLSGLAVGRELRSRGLSIRVLEARSRVGGRLRSVGGLDLGATWFWPGDRCVRALAEELGVETHEQYLEGDAMFHVTARAQRIEGNPVDVPASRFSLGAEELAKAIAGELGDAIRLGHPVEEVRITGEEVAAIVRGEAFPARHVVIALPPALAVAKIRFEPELPERLATVAARTPVWMGAMTKVVARYDEPFWRGEGLAGSAISHVGPLREVHDTSGPDGTPAALFGFAPMANPGLGLEQAVLRQLAELFGPSAAEPTELILRDWREEPFTSPAEVEELTDYRLFGHPVYQTPTSGGRLHWVSTETATESPGHIEGALSAAERAVRSISATG